MKKATIACADHRCMCKRALIWGWSPVFADPLIDTGRTVLDDAPIVQCSRGDLTSCLGPPETRPNSGASRNSMPSSENWMRNSITTSVSANADELNGCVGRSGILIRGGSPECPHVVRMQRGGSPELHSVGQRIPEGRGEPIRCEDAPSRACGNRARPAPPRARLPTRCSRW